MDFFEPTLSAFVSFLFLLLALPLWFVRVLKITLFYLYLWQLKEYHIGRFCDHFHTAKGKHLLFNKFLLGELILLILPISPLVFFFYAVDAVKTVLDVAQGKLRGPVFTRKVIPILGINITLVLMFAAFVVRTLPLDQPNMVRSFVAYSVLVPIIVSLIVLAFQPLAVFGRSRIIAEARTKRASMENLRVVGITGSYGKTSTKEFLAQILGQKYQVLKPPEHANSEMGISQTILRSLTDEHDIFVCEMGAYNKGGIKLLADIVKPDIGIVTGVNEQHLATFGSMENLLSAEGGGELAEALPKEGVLFVNQNAISRLADKIHYNAKCKVSTPQIPQTKVAKDYISFEVEGVSFRVPVYGGHNVQNLLLAIAAAQELGMSIEEIAKVAESMPLELSAMKVKKIESGATVIDSTYSANPDGVIADLEYLNLYEGKKVLVMPCLIELGPAAKEAHKRIGQKIAEVCDLAIITTKEHFEDIKEGAGGSDRVVYMENAQEIVETIKGANAILLEGGKESRLQLQLLALLLDND